MFCAFLEHVLCAVDCHVFRADSFSKFAVQCCGLRSVSCEHVFCAVVWRVACEFLAGVPCSVLIFVPCSVIA